VGLRLGRRPGIWGQSRAAQGTWEREGGGEAIGFSYAQINAQNKSDKEGP
jgi:hypothetical protein